MMNLPEEVSGYYPKQLRNRDVASGLANPQNNSKQSRNVKIQRFTR